MKKCDGFLKKMLKKQRCYITPSRSEWLCKSIGAEDEEVESPWNTIFRVISLSSEKVRCIKLLQYFRFFLSQNICHLWWIFCQLHSLLTFMLFEKHELFWHISVMILVTLSKLWMKCYVTDIIVIDVTFMMIIMK